MKPIQLLVGILTAHLLLLAAHLGAAVTTNKIEPGEIKAGSITNAGQSDFYCFHANSNSQIYLTLLLTNGPGTPWFYFSVEDEYPPGTFRSGEFVIWSRRAPQTGTYIVEVVDDSHTLSFDYLLAVTVIGESNQREPEDSPETLIPGRITSGHTSMLDFDTFTFEANSNDAVYLTLLLTNGPGSGPFFYFYDPDGEPLPGIGRTSDLANWSGRVPKTGKYTVGVLDDLNREEFDYLLRLSIIGGDNFRESGDGPEALVPGRITSGHVAPADLDTFTFTGNSNDTVYVRLLLTNGPAARPFFYLFDPDGYAFDRSSYNDFKADWSGYLPKDGKYTIAVIHYIFNGEFDYSLCLVKFPGTNSPDAGEGPELIYSGESRAGEIAPGDLDAYAFTAIAGDSLRIDMSQTSGTGQALMYLHGPDGSLVDAINSQTAGTILNHCITNTGTYRMICLDSGGTDAFGYNLSVALSPGPPPSFNPDRPDLTIFRCMTNTVLRWPTNAMGFELEYRTNLVLGTWFNLPPPYSVIANHYYITNQSSDPTRFYRLARPAK